MEKTKENKKRGRKQNMLVPTIVMGILAVILVYWGYRKGGGEHIEGLKVSWQILVEVAPMVVFSVVLAGMVQVLVTAEMTSRWVGRESGIRGILIGSFVGAITPSGPFVSMPIAAGFLRAGASIGTVVAFMTAWSLLGIGRMPIELGIMGWQFTLIRMASGVFAFPILAGLIANLLFKR